MCLSLSQIKDFFFAQRVTKLKKNKLIAYAVKKVIENDVKPRISNHGIVLI